MGSRGMLVPFYIHVVLETVHILMILNFVWNLILDFFLLYLILKISVLGDFCE